ncbi:hypothetical protein HYU13_00865 [Candidatus Woesearchaeota archaeon]|nr:hypothetical protein [Candidatus Woesearchaeota archaeon]
MSGGFPKGKDFYDQTDFDQLLKDAREHAERVRAGLRQHGPLATAYLRPGSVHLNPLRDFPQQFPAHQETPGQFDIVLLPLPSGKSPEDAPKELDHPQYGHLRYVGPHTSFRETWVRGSDGRIGHSAGSSVQSMYQIMEPGRAAGPTPGKQPMQEAYLDPFEDSKMGSQHTEPPVIDAEFEVIGENHPFAGQEAIPPPPSKAASSGPSSKIPDSKISLEELVRDKSINKSPSIIEFDPSKYSAFDKGKIIK